VETIAKVAVYGAYVAALGSAIYDGWNAPTENADSQKS